MSSTPIAISKDVLFVVSLVPEPDYEEKFNTWYDNEHVPELMSFPGFKSARRFRAIEGGPKYIALYETDNMAVFESAAYLKMRNRPPEEMSPLDREVRAHRTTEIRAMYEEILSVRRENS